MLSGAEFDVYSDSGLTNKVATITTGEDGIAKYKSLAAGNYYLKETVAPTDYVLSTKTIEARLSDETANAEGYVELEVTNSKASTLPFTGGHGPIMYVIYGLVIFLVGFYLKKRNSKKVNA